MGRILTTGEAAKRLGVHPCTIYRAIYSGLLPAFKYGGNGKSRRHWKIKEEDLEAYKNGVSGVAGAESSKIIASGTDSHPASPNKRE
jgi:excisionase family DNA binding protein